jgi:hypothetical protein
MSKHIVRQIVNIYSHSTEMSYDSKFNDQTNASPSVEEYFEFGIKA